MSGTKTQAEAAHDGRLTELLAAAGEFFEAYLWDSRNPRDAHATLGGKDLGKDVLRVFGVGYAPVGPNELIDHLSELDYTSEEIVAAGLASPSVRGRLHAQFRSRIMFPVRDRDGRILGFAGLGTHLGPSWSLWVVSPDGGPYRRSEAVFGVDLAAEEIASTGRAIVSRDCTEVLRSHQNGTRNAVTVHTNRVTRPQLEALASDVSGGIESLELQLPPGMKLESEAGEDEPAAPRPKQAPEPPPAGGLFELKKLAIVVATGLAAVNVWTGAPLLAVWVGSQVQGGQTVSVWGVLTVLVVFAALAFLLASALVRLSVKYDQLTGRPAVVGQTSPWRRRMLGELDEHFRIRYDLSAPERVVAGCVLAALLVFEVWFFFFSGSPLG